MGNGVNIQISVLALTASTRMRNIAPMSNNGRGGNQPGSALCITDCSSGESMPEASSASNRPHNVPRATPEPLQPATAKTPSSTRSKYA